MSFVASRAQRLLYRADRLLGRRWSALRRTMGLASGPRILPLDGWAGRSEIVVRARVLEQRAEVDGDGRLARMRRLYARYATVEIPGVEVEIRYGPHAECGVSDEEGRVDVTLPPDASNDHAPPEHAEMRFRDARAEVCIHRAGARARQLVISDIDDTILETELTNPLRRYSQLLFSDRRTRLPFEGVTELYRWLTASGDPIFYVSNSPWNLQEHLQQMFRRHDLPRGPLLLKDYGIRRDPDAPAHKKQALARIARAHPELPIVLIGDSTRRDAQHYLTLAEMHPGRVCAIYLREVDGLLSRGVDADRLRRRAAELGVPLIVVRDTAALAEDAALRGLVEAPATQAVRSAGREEKQRPDPQEAFTSTTNAAR